jgi:predicted metalloprotease
VPIFNRKGRLDTSQVRDRRGQRAVGLPLAAGGGGIGLILMLVLGLVLGVNPLDPSSGGGLGGLGSLDGTTFGQGPANDLSQECESGEDALERQDCMMIAFVNSIQEYWTAEYERREGNYETAITTFFTDQVNTGCGLASSAVGPFYCPGDQGIYLDLGFFDELQDRFGAAGGDFAAAYVLAHEYGHHVQNLEGVLSGGGGDTGPDSAAVEKELQADCLAGVWAGNAGETGIITRLTSFDIKQALDAAAAVGDDRIQERTQGQVNPEAWTHGSSEQRQDAFETGYSGASPAACGL